MRYLKPFNESSSDDANNLYNAAIHYFNNNINNDRALEYINKAIELSDRASNPYYFALKTMIEERKTKPRFDNNEQQKEAIKEIRDNNLAYLKDDGFIVRIVRNVPDAFFIYIALDGFNQSGTRDYFIWGSVKNHLIPFFHYLVKDFTIQDNPKSYNQRGISFVSYSTFNDESVKLSQILNDEIEDDKQIAGISIYIKSEYFMT
jgi:tetratricopeptide (TPR) repeat protein